MTEIMQVIAEAEGARTPTKKRSQKEVKEIVDTFLERSAAKKAARKTAKPTSDLKASTPQTVVPRDVTPRTANCIPLNYISSTGYVREAGFDPKTNFFYVGFAKSTWAMPSTPEVWDAFEKAVADPQTDIDAYYRKTFRGRTADMIAVKRQEVTA